MTETEYRTVVALDNVTLRMDKPDPTNWLYTTACILNREMECARSKIEAKLTDNLIFGTPILLTEGDLK